MFVFQVFFPLQGGQTETYVKMQSNVPLIWNVATGDCTATYTIDSGTMWGVKGTDPPHRRKSIYNLELALCICGSSMSSVLHPRIQPTGICVYCGNYYRKKSMYRPVQFKAMLFKGQLYLCGARYKHF